MFSLVLAGALAVPWHAHPVVAQERPAGEPASDVLRSLGLEEAIGIALERNRDLGAARARARAAGAGADGADAFLWPAVGGDLGFTRTDDPVGVFGTKLRQGRFEQADLALDALNHPDAVDDWTGTVGVSWGVLDPAAWVGREVARARESAAFLAADRRAESVVYRTRLLYAEAVRARSRLDAARAAEEAATATRDLLARRRAEGLGTDADVLRGEALLADARARRVDAARRVDDAAADLALHLGLPPDTPLVPTDSVGDGSSARDPASGAEPTGRADVRAARSTRDAAAAEARRARAARLPAAEIFGVLSTHAPDPFDGRESNLAGGVRLSVPLFTGGALGARQRAAEANARAAELEYRAAVDRADGEIREARRAVRAAGEGLDAAEAALEAAREARRLVRRRFEEGLATTADLLQAEAEWARLRNAAVDARARLEMARASLAFASGDGSAVERHGNGNGAPSGPEGPGAGSDR